MPQDELANHEVEEERADALSSSFASRGWKSESSTCMIEIGSIRQERQLYYG